MSVGEDFVLKMRNYDRTKNKGRYIMNSDLKNGTFRIRKSGLYILGEDILFHPNPENNFMPYKEDINYQTDAYSLGFYAVITIECENVIFDLNGYEISQSNSFALMQRFCANIELSTAPFIPGQGPNNFGPTCYGAKNVLIQNGKLGRSSHHGIHGNNISNILIENMCIYNFEVAGIAFNGGKYIYIENVDIGQNYQNSPVLGTFSAAVFDLIFFNSIQPYLVKYKYSKYNDLKSKYDILNSTKNNVIREILKTGKTTNPIFNNESALPDGNSYGILIHPHGFAVNDFFSIKYNNNNDNVKECKNINNHHITIDENNQNNCNDENYKNHENDKCKKDIFNHRSENIYLKNINVHDIHIKVNEIVGISLNDGSTVQSSSSGSTFQITKVTDENGKYIGNDLTNYQLALAESYLFLQNITNYNKQNIDNQNIDNQNNNNNYGGCPMKYMKRGKINGMINNGLIETSDKLPYMGRLNIEQDVIDWSNGLVSLDYVLSKRKYKCSGDAMFHVDKGLVGYRMDGVRNLFINSIKASGLKNYGYMGDDYHDGHYWLSHDFQNRIGYNGSSVTAINFSDCLNIKSKKISIHNIYSANGEACGFRFFNNCSKGQFELIKIKNISSGLILKNDVWYGTNYKGILVPYDGCMPNRLPSAIGIRLEDTSNLIDIMEKSISKLNAPGLIASYIEQ